jgi:hypothetical membrane protein
MNIARVTCLSGLVGVMIIILGVQVPALGFEGAYGEAFSILNHNISELGEQGVSELAWLFNASMILAGLLLLVFMSGLSMTLRRWPVYIISLTGIVTVTGIVMVGLYPMVDGETVGRHMLAAHLFFYGGMLSSLLFSLYAWFVPSSVFTRGSALAGTLAVISFAAFIYLPRMLYPGFKVEDYLVRLQGAGRPVLWIPSLLEWLVLFMAVFWIVMMARAICIFSRQSSSVSSYE